MFRYVVVDNRTWLHKEIGTVLLLEPGSEVSLFEVNRKQSAVEASDRVEDVTSYGKTVW